MSNPQLKFTTTLLCLLLVQRLASARPADEGASSSGASGSKDAALEERRVMQVINSYLTEAQPLKLERASILKQLAEAHSTIENLGVETFAKMTKEEMTEIGLVRFAGLLGASQPEAVLTGLEQVMNATSSCTQESTDFLTILVEHETFDGQFLNKFARKRLAACFELAVTSLPKQISRTLGKIKMNLYDVLASMGNHAFNMQMIMNQSKGQITIRDNEPPTNNQTELLRRHLRILNMIELDDFADALFATFQQQLPHDDNDKKIKLDSKTETAQMKSFFTDNLRTPCVDLVQRFKGLLEPLEGLEKFARSGITQSLEARRKSNIELDYHLEVYETCKQLPDREREVWRLLKDLRAKEGLW